LAAGVLSERRPWNGATRPHDGPNYNQAAPVARYVAAVLQSLALFRLASFALGAGLVFLLNPSDRAPLLLGMVVLAAGVFNVWRISWRFDPTKPNLLVEWISLFVDVSLSITLILLSGGLESPFLIYSLSPILTASLLLTMPGAVAIACVLSLSVLGAHLVAQLGVNDLPGLLSENFLVVSLLYGSVCMLVVGLPFLANLNWQHRVRTESLAMERDRLRREVHDNVAQTLAFLSLKMKLADQRASRGRPPITEKDVTQISSIIERAYLTVRDYLDGNDGQSDGLLRDMLAEMTSQWSNDTGLAVQLSVYGEEGQLPSQVKFQMLQVAREALANVAKHAYSNNNTVELISGADEVTIKIRDEGRGFSSSQLRGHGLGIMTERAAMAGAELSIDSNPGQGTKVEIAYARGTQERT
jgi:signal transduction histidine kinase